MPEGVAPERLAKVLSGQLNNDGYFRSTVRPEVRRTKREAKSSIRLINAALSNRQHSLSTTEGQLYASILKTLEADPFLSNVSATNLNVQAEQERIEEVLEN